jgi:thioredoxin 1
MAKFGELIDKRVPVLLCFYTDLEESSTTLPSVLKDVAAAIGDKGKVIKIEVDKNKELTEALRVVSLPTLILYKNEEMVWRKSGEENANTLIALMQQHLQEEI